MNELLLALLAEWGVIETCTMMNQIVMPNEYFGNKYFKDREGKYSDNLKIPIMRGDTIIMEAIPSGAPRPDSSGETIHKLSVELARFADTKNISVTDIKHLMSFDDPEKQKDAFAKIVGKKAGLIKNKFTATKEYMRLGAMAGIVKDGSGKTLFEFKPDDHAAFAFGAAINPEAKFEEYEDDLVNEFGYVPKYELMTDRVAFNGIWQYAEDKKLTGTNGNVKKVEVDGRTCIDYNGKIVKPIVNAYPDKFGNTRKFFENGKGLLVPVDTDAFQEFYTHAEHVDAIAGEPDEYFSTVKVKDDGSGVELIGESVAIPVNTRPYAVREIQWS
ncbi:MAG: hypothetical protein C0625_15355 [Arcobacter sp.]|nr:MAG: hypothetical protein C0625_15355 [Arcobacter sp.]